MPTNGLIPLMLSDNDDVSNLNIIILPITMVCTGVVVV
jgi:hypothetical protein